MGAFLIIFLASAPAWAATNTWTSGSGTTSWGTKDNWSRNVIPVTSDDVVIPVVGSGLYPLVSGTTNRVCGSLTVQTGATLIIGEATKGPDLTVSGTTGNITIENGAEVKVVNAASYLIMTGTYSNYGTFTITEGELRFAGTTTNCKIATNCTGTGKTIKALRVINDNDMQLNLADGITVEVNGTGMFYLPGSGIDGVFNAGNNTTLITYGSWGATTGTFNRGTSTVILRGIGNVPPNDFYNLTIDGTFSLAQDTYVYGNLEITAQGSLSTGAYMLYVYGNWVNNGSFNAGTGEVQFIGTPSSAITGTTTFNIVSFGDGTNAKTITLQGGSDIKATNTLQISAQGALNGSPAGGPNATLTIPSGCTFVTDGIWQPQQGTFIWQKADPDNLPALVNGFYNLTVESDGNVTPDGFLTVGNNLYIKTGTFNGGTGLTHNVGGDWSQDGSFSAGTSTVRFTGGDCELLKSPSAVGALTFNNLTVSSTATTKIEYGKSVTVTGTFNITAGQFQAGTATVFTTGSWSDSGSFSAGTSEFIWNGTTLPEQAGGAAHEDFYSLTINGAGALDGTNSDKVFTVNKHLKINSGGSLNAGTGYTVEIKGDFQQDGSFSPGDSTLRLNGTTKQTLKGSAALTLNNLEINKTAGDTTAKTVELGFGVTGVDLTVNGTTNILAGILDFGSTADTMRSSGNLTVGNGSGSDDSILKMLGGVTLQMGNGTVLEVKTPDGILETAKSGLTPLITSDNPGANFYYVKVSGKTKVNGLQVTSLGSAGVFTDPAANHGFTVLTTADIYTAGDTYFDQVIFDDIQNSGTRDTYLRIFRNGASPQLEMDFNKHIYDDGTTDSNMDVNVYLNRGSTGSTIIQTMSSGNKGGGNGETYDMRDDSVNPGDDPDPGSVQWPVVKIWKGTLSNAWNIDGNWKLEDGSGTTAPVGSDSVTIPANPDSSPDIWPVISSNVAVKNITMETPASGSATTMLSVSGSWTLTIYGSWTVNTNANFDPGTSTVDYAGSSGQGVVATTYYNLKLSNASGLQMVFEPIVVYNNLDILVGVNFVATTNEIRVGGNWNNYGTFSPGNCLLKFNGNTGGEEQTITGGQFKHMEFSGQEPKLLNGNIETLGGITITDGATVSATNESSIDVKVGGNFIISGTFSAGLSTVIFNGATTQELVRPTAGAILLNNLKLLNTGTILRLVQQSGGPTGDSITIATRDNAGNTNLGNINIGSGTTLDATNDIINCGGNWSASGTFTFDGSTVNFTASAAQSIKTNSMFNILVITNTGSGYVSAEGNLTIIEDLTILDGQFKLDVGAALAHTVTDDVTIASGAAMDMGISTLTIGSASVFGDLLISGVFVMSGTDTAAPTLKMQGDSATVDYTNDISRPDITVQSGGLLQCLWSSGSKPTIQAYNPIDPGPFYSLRVVSGGTINVSGLTIDSAYTYDSAMAIYSALLLEPDAVCTDLDNVDYQNISGGVAGTYRGLQFRLASGTYNFNGCTFDDSCTYNVRTDNGDPTINMNNTGGTRGVSTYEEEELGTINWIANRTWNGGASTSWSVTSNWDNAARADTVDENAIINKNGSYDPIVNTTYSIRNLIIKPNNFVTLNTNRNLTIAGDVQIESGGGITLTTNTSAILYVSGNWDNQGGILDQQSTGGIIYLRGINNTISTENGFRKLSLDTATAVYTLTDGAVVAISGTSASYFINTAAMLYGGNNTNQSTLKASVWTTNLGRFSAGNSKFVWMGTTDIPLETYYDLQIGSNIDSYNIATTYTYGTSQTINRHFIVDAGSTLTLNQTGGTFTIKGDIWVKQGGTLNLNNATVRVEGDLIADGVINMGTSTLIFGGGVVQRIRSTITPPSLTLNNIQVTTTTTAELNMPITVTNINSGLASPHGIIKLNAYQLTITGLWNDADAGDNLNEDTGTVYFYGTSATIPNETWYNLAVGADSVDTTYTLPNNTTVKNDLTFNENGLLSALSYILYVGRHWTDNGTEDNFIEGAGEVQFNGAVQQNISSDTFNNLTISNTGVAMNVLALGKIAVTGNLAINSGELNLGTNLVGVNKHTVGGYCYINKGKLKANTSSISITGLLRIGDGINGGLVDMTGNSTDDPDLTATGGVDITATGTLDMTGSSASISCGANWVKSGVFNIGTGRIIMNGSNNTISGAGTGDFYNLEINSVGVISCSSNIGVTNNLTISAGEIRSTLYALRCTGNISNSGTVTVNTGGLLDLEGNITGGVLQFGSGSCQMQVGGSFAPTTLDAGEGTIIFDNTAAGQNIPSYTYNNLTISKGGQMGTATGNLTINGILNVTGGTFDSDDASVRVHNIGSISNSGTVRMDLVSTVNVSSATTNTGTINIGIGTYNNTGNYINTNGSTILGAGLLNIDGDITGGTLDFNNSAGTLRIAGVFTPATLNEDIGTIIFDGTAQTIPAETYYHLKTGSINTAYTLGGAVVVKGNLTIDEIDDATKSTLNTNNYGITITGNAIFNGSFTAGSGTVEFNAPTGSVSISKGTNGDSIIFNNLEVNIGTNAVLQPTSGFACSGTLNILSGKLDLGSGLNYTITGTSTAAGIIDINGSTLTCVDNLTINASGKLIMRNSGILKMADTKAIAINGNFETYWTTGQTKPKITTSGTVGTNAYSFDANSGSNIDISGLTVESIDASGLRINSGANIVDIDDVVFVTQVAPSGGAALNLQVTAGYGTPQTFTFSDMSFDGSYKGSAVTATATVGNVVVANNSVNVVITMSNAIDNVSPPPGKEEWDWDSGNVAVNWIELNTWLGNTGSWNVAGNWTYGIPDGTKDILIPTAPTGGNFPVLDTTGNCIGLKIENGASITLSSTYNLEVKGDVSVEGTGVFNHNNGRVILNGTGSQTIDLGTAIGNKLYDLEINKTSGTVTILRDITIDNNLALTGTLNSGNKTITINGSTTNNGTLQVAGGVFDINGNLTGGTVDGGTGTIRFSGTTFAPTTFTASSSTVIFDNKAADQNIPVLAYNNLEIDKYSGVTSYTAQVANTGINIQGRFKVTSGIFKADPTNAGWSHSIAGNCEFGISNSEFKAGIGTITLTGVSQVITPNNNFYKLVITGSAQVTSGYNLKTDNNLTIKSGATLTLNSNTGHTIAGNATIENTGRFDLSTGTLAITNGLNNSGTVDMDQVSILSCAAFTNTATGILDCGTDTASQITVAGNWNDSGTVNPGNSTITLTGVAGYSIASAGLTDFYHLNITGNYTALTGLDIEGNVKIIGTFNPDVYTHKVGGNWDDSNGTFSATGGTVTFDGIGAKTITTKILSGNNKFYNLNIGDDTNAPSVVISAGGDLRVGGILVINTGSSLTLNSSTGHNVTGSVTIDNTSGLFVKTGQLTTGAIANNGTIDLSETTVSNGKLIAGSVTNNNSITFGTSGGGKITCNGSFVSSAGTFTKGVSTVEVAGAASNINLPLAKGAFYNLAISGTVSTASSIQIDNNLIVSPSCGFNLGTALTTTVTGNITVLGTFNINNSTLVSNGNLTVNNGGILQVFGSNTSGQEGQLKVANTKAVSIQGFFQSNPSVSFTYKPVITRSVSGARYSFVVENSGGLDINGLIFEYTGSDGLTIASTANAANIDIDDCVFRYVQENPAGTKQGNGARHLYIGFTSGSFAQTFDACTFDTSFGTTTGNNVVGASTSGSTLVSFSNYGGSGSGPVYEWEGNANVLIKWLGSTTWEGNNSTVWTDNGNWSNGAPGSENSAIVVYPASGRLPIMDQNGSCASLEITNDGSLDINGKTLTITGNFTLASTGTLQMTTANSEVRIAGNWTNTGGILNQTAGLIVFNGSNSVISSEPNFRSVSITGTASLATGASVKVSTGFAIQGGNFSLNNATFYTTTWAKTGTFNANTGTFIWLGTASVPVESYYHLHIGDGSTTFATTFSNSTYNITKNLTVKMVAPDYADAQNALIRIGGNLTIDGTTTSDNVFKPSSSSVIFNGSTTQTIEGTAQQPFILNNISISGTATILSLQGNVSVSNINSGLTPPHGIIKLNDKQLTVTGLWDDSDSGDNLTEDTGAVYFYGTSATIPNETWYNLAVGALSVDTTYTLPNNATVKNDITFNENGLLSALSYMLYVGRHWTDNGSEDNFIEGTGEVQFNGTVGQNISGDTFNNLSISNTGVAVNVSALGKIAASNNLVINSGTLDLGSGFTGVNKHTVVGYCYVNQGKLKLNTSSISISGLLRIGDGTNSGILDITGNSTDDPDLTTGGGVDVTATGTLDMTGSVAGISIAGNWTDNGTFNIGSSTVTMTGGSATCSASGSGDFYNLVINSPATVSLGSNVGVSNNVTVTAGELRSTLYALRCNGNLSNAGTVTVNNSGLLDLEGNLTGGTLQFDSGNSELRIAGAFGPATLNAGGGTIVFDNTASGQNIPSYTYNNLTISKAGQIGTAAGDLTVNGILNITSGTFDGDDASVRVHSINSISNSGTVRMDIASTMNITSVTTNTGVVNIGSGTYNNNGNLVNTAGLVSVGTAGLLDLGGNFTGGTLDFNNSTGTLRIAGVFSPATLNEDVGTIIFDGTGQTIPSETYYHLKTGSINTTYTLGGAIAVKGNLVVDETDDATKSTLNTNNYGITVTGNAVFNGSFTAGAGTVEFNTSSGSVSISKGTNGDAIIFNNLSVNIGTNAVLQPSAGFSCSGDLQVSTGKLDLGSAPNYTITGTATANGSIDINGSTLTCKENLTIQSGGKLIMRNSGILKMADTKAIAINGNFETYWATGQTKPKITTSGVVGTNSYVFNANSGSNVDISGLTVESIDAQGLRINSGANIVDIDDVEFLTQVAPTGGAALNLQVTSGYATPQSFTFSDMSFDGSYKGSAITATATVGNVVVANNAVSVAITMSNAIDNVSPPPGKEEWDWDSGNVAVNWIELNTWIGNTTSWNTIGNWTYGIPDGTKDILIPTAPTGGNFPVLDTTGNCIGLKIENGASITLSNTYNLEVKGDISIEGTGIFTALNGKVILNGAGSQTIDLGTTVGNKLYNLEINKTAGIVTVLRDLTIDNDLAITGTLNSGNKTVTINGTTTNNGTIQVSGGILDINGNLTGGTLDGGTGTIRFSGTTFAPTTFTASLSTIIFDNQSSSQNIPVLNYYNLTIDKYGASSQTADAAASGINLAGEFRVIGGIFNADPSNLGWSHTIAGNVEFGVGNSEFKAGQSTITLTGISQVITPNNNFYKLAITGSAQVTSGYNLKTDNNLTIKSGATLTLNSNTGHTIAGNATIENTGRFDLSTGTLAITNGLNNSGTVDMDQVSILSCAAFTNTATGILDCGTDTASQITVAGNWNDGGTVNPGNSTVNLTGNSKAITTSSSTDFYHLNINGNYTAYNGLDIAGNININTNGVLNAGSFTHKVAGNWNDSSGTFTGGTSTVILVGTTQSINTDVGSGNNRFYNLTIGDGIATPSVSVTSGKDLEVMSNLIVRSGQLTLNSNTVHTVGASLTVTSTLNASTGKITISGPVTNSGTIDLSSSASTSQGLKSNGLVNTGTGTLNFGVSGAGMIECDGNWSDTGSFTVGNSTVKIIGAARSIRADRAAADFYNLLIVGSAAVDVASANGLDIDGSLKVNTNGSLDLGTAFVNDVASILEVGDASTSGTLNINNSKLTVSGNLTVYPNSTLQVSGSNTAAQVGELKMANNTTVYIQGFFQSNPSGSFTYKPEVTRSASGARYDFIVQSGGGIDLNGLIFEYAKKDGLTIQSTASTTNIDIDDVVFQYVEEDPSGTGQGNGARHVFIGFTSGTVALNFDNCSFDTSFGTATGNNIVAVNTSGSTTINFTNWSGAGAGDSYEWQDTNTNIIWIGDVLWLGGAVGTETNWNVGANWSTGSKPGEGSNVIIQDRTYDPSFNEAATVASLVIQDGAILNMSGAYQLTVNSNVTINGGTTGGRINITNAGATLKAKQDFLDNTSAGGINQTAGKIILTGNNNTFYASTVKTLEIGDGATAITITVPAGKTITAASNGTLTVKSLATLNLSNATFNMGNGSTINVNSDAALKALNSSTITTPVPGTDRFYFLVSGIMDLDGVTIRSMMTNGLDIQPGATIQNLKNTAFYNHPGGTDGRFITIPLPNLDMDLPGCYFDTISTGYNVSATGSASVLRFETYNAGPGAGDDKDYDADTSPDDGVADNPSTGTIVSWIIRSVLNTASTGGTQGFPVVAYDLNTYGYYGTYVVSRDIVGTTDRLSVLNGNGFSQYYYDVSQTYGDIISFPWYYTEGTAHTVYFGTTNGYLFRLIDTGSALNLSIGWPLKVCDEITSAVVPDGTNIYFGGIAGGTPMIYGVEITTRAVPLSATVTSPIRATPSWDKNTEGLTYLFVGSDNPTPLLYRVNVTAHAIDKQNTGPLDNVRAPTIYWPWTQGVYVADYSGRMHGVNAWSTEFTNLTGFPRDNAAFSITAMASVEYYWFDATTRLVYADTGGNFYVRKLTSDATNGDAYDPGSGAYPINLGGGVAIESSPLPDNDGLIYVGNNNGKVFIVNESSKAVIKTYSFGAGIKIGDISHDGENNRYLVPTSTGKIYYIQ